MQINSFLAKNLHGYLDYEFDFRPQINFIHGINGTGKTSLINAIIALIDPDYEWLSTNIFDFLRVDITYNEKKFTISANFQENEILLVFSSPDGESQSVIRSEFIDSFRSFQHDRYSSKDQKDALRQKVISDLALSDFNAALESIPTPLFLGIDRRATKRNDSIPPRWSRQRPIAESRRIHSNPSLGLGLNHAIFLIESEIQKIAREREKHGVEFRNDFISLFFALPEGQTSLNTEWPTNSRVRRYESINRRLMPILEQIGYPRVLNEKIVEPFFARILKTSNALKIYRNFGEAIEKEELGENSILDQWILINNRMPMINKLFDIIERYENDIKQLSARIDNFTTLVNSFLKDSGKKLVVTEDREVYIELPNNTIVHPEQLSSGEMQIFLLLTHITFNRNVKNANCLIIDEPELSLHVQWQERFVDAVVESNANMQFIFATHSPSIIGKRRSYCIAI